MCVTIVLEPRRLRGFSHGVHICAGPGLLFSQVLQDIVITLTMSIACFKSSFLPVVSDRDKGWE